MTGVRPGDTRELVVVKDLTRSQIVQYAGASGDFNPVHTDERFATRVAGHPSVFAHGMLTMGLAGRIVTDWFGVEALRMYDAQFRRPVYPGATLTVLARVESVERSVAKAYRRGPSWISSFGLAVSSAKLPSRTRR